MSAPRSFPAIVVRYAIHLWQRSSSSGSSAERFSPSLSDGLIGTWKLNPAKSKGMKGGTTKIAEVWLLRK